MEKLDHGDLVPFSEPCHHFLFFFFFCFLQQHKVKHLGLLQEFSSSCTALAVRTPKSQMAAVLTRALLLPQLARKGLIPPSEVLRFPASCLYPQLFVLSPLSCPLSRTSHRSDSASPAAHRRTHSATAVAVKCYSLPHRS